MSTSKRRTVWILGDQLSLTNAALLSARRENDRLLFIESRKGFGKLPYHRHRLLLILSAMRHFAAERKAEGWEVLYHRLGESPDALTVLLEHCAEHSPESILLAQPNNFGEQAALTSLAGKLPVILAIIPTAQFLCSHGDFAEMASGKKRLLMENFYREMRRRTGLLMGEDGQPAGGAWNYDAENRGTFREWEQAGSPLPPPCPEEQQDDITRDAAADLEKHFPDAPGNTADFFLPVTRGAALAWLDHFVSRLLPRFGNWQDLMVSGESFLFHSILSPMLNIGLLDPLECAKAAEGAWKEGFVPLTSAEGFIRQIIGWREFVNGVYWLKMPDYARVNGLGAKRPLPRFFRDGNTDMRCLGTVIGEVHRHGYNHHIERLMILGNFLLLAGIDPSEALDWFNSMYVDAHDWVMAANLLGMALHADGGFMATKPYAGGAAYIGRMSNHCERCSFDPSLKSGEKNGKRACPYNLLYWNFYDTHADRFANNPRTAMPVRSWRKRPESERQRIVSEARKFLETLG